MSKFLDHGPFSINFKDLGLSSNAFNAGLLTLCKNIS